MTRPCRRGTAGPHSEGRRLARPARASLRASIRPMPVDASARFRPRLRGARRDGGGAGASTPASRRRDLACRPGGPGHRFRGTAPAGPDARGLPAGGGRPKSAALESAVWVAESPSVARVLSGTASPTTTVSPGRLVVLLFQKDFEGSRLRGLLRAIGQAKGLLAPLSPRDRVAVLSYDSHLRLHLDFTPTSTRCAASWTSRSCSAGRGRCRRPTHRRSRQPSTARRPSTRRLRSRRFSPSAGPFSPYPARRRSFSSATASGDWRAARCNSIPTTARPAPPSTRLARPSSAWTSPRRRGTPSRSASSRSRKTPAASTSRCTRTPAPPSPGSPPRSPATTSSPSSARRARGASTACASPWPDAAGTVLTRTRYVD